MISYLFTLLAIQPTWLAVVNSVHRVLPMEKPRLYCLISLATMDVLWFLDFCILKEPIALLGICILLVPFLLLPFFAAEGQKLLSAFTLAITVSMSLLLSNLIALCLMDLGRFWGMEARRFVDFSDPLCIIKVGAEDIVVVFALGKLTHALANNKNSALETRQQLWFLSVPFSQAILLSMLHENLSRSSSVESWVMIVSGTLLCMAADFASILGYRKFQSLQQMAEQGQEAERQLNIQNEYYRDMQERILQINRIRHDLNNQLKTAYYLLEQGHPQEVRQQLDCLQSSIQDQVGTRYCENMVVDAVLQEKAAQCQDLGIAYAFRVLVPADLKIENAHLCSAFSNLLDNAIAAVQTAEDPSAPITLRSDIHKGYLTICCSNPSGIPRTENKTDILRRHGLGLGILSKITALHQGSCETDYRDGTFYVTLVLKNA